MTSTSQSPFVKESRKVFFSFIFLIIINEIPHLIFLFSINFNHFMFLQLKLNVSPTQNLF